jgi:hypothetical protein
MAVRHRFPAVAIERRSFDFTDAIPAGPFDGVLVANALHFVRDRDATLRAIRFSIAEGGRLVIVEYDGRSRQSLGPAPVLVRDVACRGGPRRLRGAPADRPRLEPVPRRDLLGRRRRPAGAALTECYTPRLTVPTERSRSDTATERARDGASRAGTAGPKSLASRAAGVR